MKISVIGSGAIGSYYGAMIAKTNNDIHFLLRSQYKTVKKNGIKIVSDIDDGFELHQINVYNDVTDMPISDIILVALKTTQNKLVLSKLLSPIVNQDSIVILIQNGLGMEEDLAEELPTLQIAGATAIISSYENSEGIIIHQGSSKLDLGSYNLRSKSKLEYISSILQEQKIPSEIKELKYLRWKKLVWNMSFNGLSVYLDKTTEQILEDPTSFLLCKTIMEEVVDAATANEVKLGDNFVDEMIMFTKRMKPYKPSMKLDYDLGRPMEIEYLYQKPIEKSRNAGFIMTNTISLYESLRQLDENNFK